MNHLDRTLALLAETCPPAAAALRAVGSGADGCALPGLVGFMSLDECRAVMKACRLAADLDDLPSYMPVEQGAGWLRSAGNWLTTQDRRRVTLVMDAVTAWAHAHGRENALPDILDVQLKRRAWRQR